MIANSCCPRAEKGERDIGFIEIPYMRKKKPYKLEFPTVKYQWFHSTSAVGRALPYISSHPVPVQTDFASCSSVNYASGDNYFKVINENPEKVDINKGYLALLECMIEENVEIAVFPEHPCKPNTTLFPTVKYQWFHSTSAVGRALPYICMKWMTGAWDNVLLQNACIYLNLSRTVFRRIAKERGLRLIIRKKYWNRCQGEL